MHCYDEKNQEPLLEFGSRFLRDSMSLAKHYLVYHLALIVFCIWTVTLDLKKYSYHFYPYYSWFSDSYLQPQRPKRCFKPTMSTCHEDIYMSRLFFIIHFQLVLTPFYRPSFLMFSQAVWHPDTTKSKVSSTCRYVLDRFCQAIYFTSLMFSSVTIIRDLFVYSAFSSLKSSFGIPYTS